MDFITTSLPIDGAIESRIGGREENQDSFGYLETRFGLLVVVCDGMGGMNGGKVASSIAVNSILSFFSSIAENKLDPDDLGDCLHQAVCQANMDIIHAASMDASLTGMGTTATATLINKDCIYGAFAGDSRIYLFRGRGKSFRTFDHSMVFEMVRNGFLTEEQARLSSQSNVIVNALGVSPIFNPELFTIPYCKNDRLLLCSDGFWGAMPEKDFIREMTASGRVDTILKTVSDKVEAIGLSNGGGHDNLTSALLILQSESELKSPMTKKNKILVAVLAILLLLSIALNAFLLRKSIKPNSKFEQIEQIDTVKVAGESIKNK